MPRDSEAAPHSTDHRKLWDFKTRYGGAWPQITAELAYLLAVLGLSIAGISISLDAGGANSLTLPWGLDRPIDALLPWSAMFFAALAGGTTFALKWLYHAVAKGEWNRDRVLWRFIAPLNSATLATCSGFGIAAGIMPFVDQNSFEATETALFFGFFIGHFSDHVLAALQRKAKEWFGTVDEPGGSDVTHK